MNENHHKVIEFTILRRSEGWQYQQDIFFKKRDFNKLRELVATPLGNVFYADGSVEYLEDTKKVYEGLKPNWTLLYFLKLL